MIVLIAGTTHSGKTLAAQKLLEKYKFPYLSIDHLKMGLIRSGLTDISVCDDERLTPYLWSIVKEIIKTAIENGQNLIVEGCYIPFYWQKDFEENYLKEIKYFCLIMTERYIENSFDKILQHGCVIEKRLDNSCDKEELKKQNAKNLRLCKLYKLNYVLIDEKYSVEIDLKND